jgi:hypothetical protein
MLNAAVAAVAVMAVVPGVASADRYVNSAHFSATGKDNSCSTAVYSKVQDAVDAAKPGEKVYLCGTAPYTEYVVIVKNLQLTGDPGAAIQAPATDEATNSFWTSRNLQSPNAIVSVLGSVNVQINGLTIEGPFSTCGGAAFAEFGVLILGGAHAQLNKDTVSNITDPSNCAFGVGVQAGAEYWTNTSNTQKVDFTADVQVENTTVSSYQEVGITVDGSRSKGHIESATVHGDGLSAANAQVGIQISDGATGEVQKSTITDNEASPSAGAVATGIEIFGGCIGPDGTPAPLTTDVQVHDNSLTNNDVGVAVSEFDPNSPCTSASTAPPTTPTNVQIHDNTIVKNDGDTNHTPFPSSTGPYTGYQAGISDSGNNDHIEHNKMIGTPGSGPPDPAYGPMTTPGGPFLVPIDVQSEPTVNPHVHDNTLNGKPTSPLY